MPLSIGINISVLGTGAATGTGPVFDTQPTLDATDYLTGATVTRTLGTSAAGTTITVESFTLGGVDKESEVSSNTWDTTGESRGTISFQCRVTDDTTSEYNLSNIITANLIELPAAMSAPTVTSTGATSVSVALAAAPDDGGSAITQYDLRHSTDEAAWTTVTDISDPEAITGLSEGTLYYVQTRAVNIGGDGGWSASGSATTDDATAPTFDSGSPADGATGVDALPTLVLTFSENVVAGSGTFGIRETGGSTFETFTSSLGTGNRGGTITFSGDEVTITPGYGMDPSGAYHMEWSSDAVQDAAGNPVAANTDATTYNWVISSTAPTVSGVSGTATSGTTATWAATSDTAGGTMIAAVIEAGDPAPTKYEIITDQPNVSGLTSTDATPTADGNNGGTFDALEQDTTYDVYVIHVEPNGGTNDPVKSASTFSTSTATPPVADSILVGTQGSDGDIPITVTNLDIDATGSKGVLTTSATAPTAAQVIAGTDHTDTAASLAFDFSVTTGSPTDTVSTGSLTTGTYYLYTVLGDGVPNYSTTPYSGGSVAVDLTVPTFDSGSPADGASTVAVDSAFVLTFSETVVASTGTFALVETGVGTVETFDTDAGTGDDSGTISVSGTDVTITPGSNLSNSTGYHFTWTASAVVDSYGNAVAAETGATAYNFTTVAGASAPSLLATYSTSTNNSNDVEIGPFDIDGTKVIYVSVAAISTVTTGDTIDHCTLGDQSRAAGDAATAGEGQDATFTDLSRNSRVFTMSAMFEAPPSASTQTIRFGMTTNVRSFAINVYEVPGAVGSGAQTGAATATATTSSVTSLSADLTTTAANSIIMHTAAIADGKDADPSYTNATDGSLVESGTGGASDDAHVLTAWRTTTTAQAYTDTVSFGTVSGRAGRSRLEILA